MCLSATSYGGAYAQDVIPHQAPKSTATKKQVKHISFEGISMDSAWNLCLELENREFKSVSTDFVNGMCVSEYDGLFGPQKDAASVFVCKPLHINMASCIIVILRTKRASLNEIKSYLEKSYVNPVYNELTNGTYKFFLCDGVIELKSIDGKIMITYLQ